MGAMAATVGTDTASGRLRLSPRLMPPQLPTTAMVVMVVMEAMADTDTARGLLMPMPTTAMAAAMEVMEAMADTDTARGPLMPMPTMAMEVMEAMADTERGPLTLTTDMVVMAVATDTAMASNSFKSVTIRELSVLLMILTQIVQHPIMTIVISDTN